MREFGAHWVEEPIAADQGPDRWAALAGAVDAPLAAGENLRGFTAFHDLMASRAIRYLQPDLGKWGGFSGCRIVARRDEEAGSAFCPHWLGGPVGLLASMHLRAAIGDAGWLEWDANPNPTHEFVVDQLPLVVERRVELADRPGLGLAVDPLRFADLVSWYGEARSACTRRLYDTAGFGDQSGSARAKGSALAPRPDRSGRSVLAAQ